MRDVLATLDRVINDMSLEIQRLTALRNSVLLVRSTISQRSTAQPKTQPKRKTKFEKILDVLREKGRNGLRVAELHKFLLEKGEDCTYNAVSSYLVRARKNGLAVKKKPYWFPVFLDEPED